MTTTATPTIDNIGHARLDEMRSNDTNVRILDVRTGAEFETSHIPGSYNVPLDTLAEHASEFANVDEPLVLVCQSGARAAQAHSKLVAEGKNTLHILDGGMNAWEKAGLEINRGDNNRWAMDRQVRMTAGSISLAAIVTSVAVPKAKWIAGGVASGLVYSAVSNTCAMANILSRLPYNRTDSCDINQVLTELSETRA